MINLSQFKLLFPKAVKMPEAYNTLVAEMFNAEIITDLRSMYFFAQMAHETCGFKYIGELGGRSYFTRYDGRMGNIVAGDGYKYRGRGWIQLTGKYNYTLYGQKLGIDLKNNPDLAGTPSIAAKVACLYWTDHGCNALADNRDFRTITKKINGGLNGYTDRLNWLAKIRHVVGG